MLQKQKIQSCYCYNRRAGDWSLEAPRKSLEKIQNKISESFSIYEKLNQITSPQNQYAKYRKALHTGNPPLIPFISVYFADLTFIEHGNSDTLMKSVLINFEKRRKAAAVIREVQQFKNTNYGFENTEIMQN